MRLDLELCIKKDGRNTPRTVEANEKTSRALFRQVVRGDLRGDERNKCIRMPTPDRQKLRVIGVVSKEK